MGMVVGRGLTRLRGIPDHAVAFPHGFAHEAELAVLEITDAAVGHAGRGGAGARAEIGPVDQQGVHPLQGQVAEGADAVDAAADDQDGGGMDVEGGEEVLSVHVRISSYKAFQLGLRLFTSTIFF